MANPIVRTLRAVGGGRWLTAADTGSRRGCAAVTAGCGQAGQRVGSAGGTSCRRSWDTHPLSGHRRSDGRRCTRTCKSSPRDAGGRSTSQHSQLGRSSSTPQVYLMMTAGTHQPPCHHSQVPRRLHGRALSASAADARQPMRGLNLLLRRPPRCFAHSRTALTLVEVPHPAMLGKH